MQQFNERICPFKKYFSWSSLTLSDYISIGVFTALYFVLVAVGAVAAMLLPFYSLALTPVVSALFSAPVYIILAKKIQKFGAITIMGLVIGLFFLFSGHFALSIFLNIAAAVAADIIACSGSFGKIALYFSNVVHSLGLFGPVIPIYFFRQAYIQHLLAKGHDNAYVVKMTAGMDYTTLSLSLVMLFICSALGCIMGFYILKKHFYKAGFIKEKREN